MGGVTKFLLKAGAIAAAVVLVFGAIMRIFFVTPVNVGHNGMAPTMLAGEQVLMWKGSEGELGDIVVCAHPSTSEVVIGRIIATGGMEVSSDRGQLDVSGTVPDIDLMDEVSFYNTDAGRNEPMTLGIERLGNTEHQIFMRERAEFRVVDTTVPTGRIYILGDNRGDNTHDSRAFGPVDPTTCIGTLFMRWKAVDDGAADLGHGWLDILD